MNIELKSTTGTKCPRCKNKESFINYLDSKTGLPIKDSVVGKCSNENCSYDIKQIKNKKKYLNDLIIKNKNWCYEKFSENNDIYFGLEVNKYWKANPSTSNLVSFLLTMFTKTDVKKAIATYRISSPDFESNNNVLWYYDTKENLVDGKVICFDLNTGKYKTNSSRDSSLLISQLNIRMIHFDYHYYDVVLRRRQLAPKKVLFGLHLLPKKNYEKIFVVENEVAAIIASIVIPEHLWVATGGQKLDYDIVKPILGHDVILIPNIDNYDEWRSNAKRFGFKLSRFPKESDYSDNTNLLDFFMSSLRN